MSYAPGERFNYSHATDLLGVIIGRATGLGTRAAMQQLLFDPLGMVDTDFWIPPEKRDRAAVLYRSPAPGNFLAVDLPGFMDQAPPSFCAGGQGLVSTADDYLAFARMLLQGGEFGGTRVLSRGISPIDDHQSTDAGAAAKSAIRHSLLHGPRVRSGAVGD